MPEALKTVLKISFALGIGALIGLGYVELFAMCPTANTCQIKLER